MKASVNKRGATTYVRVRDVKSETREEILEFAMQKAGETAGSLFGKRVGPVREGTCTVELHTD